MAGSSWYSSGLTFDDSSRFVDQEETSRLDVIGRESMSTEWTNEKHSLYISSMEASFVEQLYNSKDSFGWRPQTKQGLDVKSRAQGNLRASGQIKNSNRPDPQPEAYVRDNPANTRNKHVRVRGKAVMASSSYAGELPCLYRSGNISRQYTEVSDQNFAEDCYEPDKLDRLKALEPFILIE